MTYYEILQISENASDEVIRMAYKALAKKYHPDIFDGDPQIAEIKMKELNEAYEILSDSQKRQEYDASIHNARDSQNSSRQTTSKKPNIFAKILKGFHAWSKLKKIVLLLTCISFVLLIVFNVSYDVVEDKFVYPARHHYSNTITKISSSETEPTATIGCGNQSCRYCEGIKKTISYDGGFDSWSKAVYGFNYIQELREVSRFLYNCANVFLILSILGIALLIALIVIPKIKTALKNRKATPPSPEPPPTQHGKLQFCKYCGVRIDEESRFCQSCGKKLI